MAICDKEEAAQCLHQLLIVPESYPKLHDRPRLAAAGAGVLGEVASIFRLTGPMVGAGILLYLRSLVSMIFLGRLGQLPLAGGSLALGFANITGYSVLSGLAGGMDPVCGQAFGAGRTDLLRAALRRTVVLLLAASVPISALWVAMHRVLVATGQDPDIAATAYAYILCSLPDLAVQCFLHPIRIYLRAQSVTLPLTYAAAAALLFHVPINFVLVDRLGLGIRGVALGAVCTNLNCLLFLAAYVCLSGMYGRDGDGGMATAKGCEEDGGVVREWWSLVRLSVHSCMSVCLEWWWYEIMVLLCGVLADPKAAVAAMGVLIQTTSLIYIFPHSLGCAVSTRVGHELGAGRPDRARLVARVGLGLGAALGLVAFAFAVSVRAAWGRMFTTEDAILKLAAAALPLLGAAELGNCPQTAGCGVLRGSARPEKAARINVSAFYGAGMPVALALAFWPVGLDFRGMWGGMLAAQLVCAWLMLRAVLGTDWAEQTERARVLTGGRDDGYAVVVVVHDDTAKPHAEMAKSEADTNTLLMAIDRV
ncbi:protein DETOXIFICATION 49 [Oryza brachyantha]|uniref:Protein DETOXIFICATION n=1 Tax=Oryza brachyantha TaxID=4533 RepID=A6MD00_ORYBR|nr:protein DETOXIFICATION 49 [Oryza brachyantha]ABG73448.1 MATE efflux family protein [Oryza brachyantha]